MGRLDLEDSKNAKGCVNTSGVLVTGQFHDGLLVKPFANQPLAF